MSTLFSGLLICALVVCSRGFSDSPSSATPDWGQFDPLAESALVAMKRKAQELNIQGVGLVAYIPGGATEAWSSKMVVVGRLKTSPTEKSKGNNLLGIAYSKAAEMAETLKDSGKAGRPAMTGETGWEGGLIVRCKTGYLLAAFSGGPSEADLKVARAGLKELEGKL